MTQDGMPLFQWQPPCQVIAFPAVARIGKIRSTAKSISESRTEREASSRWDRTYDALESSLVKAGIKGEALHKELDSFMAAVDLELIGLRSAYRLRGCYDPDDNGGAA